MLKRYLHFLGFALIIVATALIVRVTRPMQGWVDLLAASDLKYAGGGHGFQRWVKRPRDSPLLLTLEKNHGGNHNRGWCLEVSASDSDAKTRPSGDRQWSWGWENSPKLNPDAIATFHALECVDDFQFGQTVPQFWYRIHEGRLEVLARQLDNPWNRDFGYEEGYYLWTPGEPWRESNS